MNPLELIFVQNLNDPKATFPNIKVDKETGFGRLKKNALKVDSKKVSGVHGVLYPDAILDGEVAKSKGSSNGTYVLTLAPQAVTFTVSNPG